MTDLIGEYVQIITTQSMVQQEPDGSITEGPMGMIGTLLDLDDTCVLLDPKESPPRFVNMQHIVSIDVLEDDPEIQAIKDALSDPKRGQAH